LGSRTVWKIATGKDTAIHLYSHWGGDDKMRATAEALLRSEGRWEDRTYFTRIFTSWIINDSWDMETGHGLWAGPINEEYFEESYAPVIIYPIDHHIEWDGERYTFQGFISKARNEVGIAEGAVT